MADNDYPSSVSSLKFPAISYNVINTRFDSGEYFIDSFTYTSFIDYSLVGEGGDEKIGIYSDEFLTDYNCGRYEESYMGAGRKN